MRALWRRVVLASARPTGTAIRAVRTAGPGVGGALLVSYGAWQAWPPAGPLAAGGLLLADMVWDQIRGDRGVKR